MPLDQKDQNQLFVLSQRTSSLLTATMCKPRHLTAAMSIRHFSVLMLSCMTAASVVPPIVTDNPPDLNARNQTDDVLDIFVPITATILPTNLSDANALLEIHDAANTEQHTNGSTTGGNSTTWNTMAVPEAALLGEEGEVITTGNDTAEPIAQQLKLTDMSKVKQFVPTTIPPFMTTPITEETSTVSETEILLRKLANDILMRLFEKFVLKAAAVKAPTKPAFESTAVVPTARTSTRQYHLADRRQPSQRRRLFLGRRGEYEGLEEFGYYRPELESEGYGSF